MLSRIFLSRELIVLLIVTSHRLAWAQIPSNDLCAAAVNITSLPFSSRINTTLATPDENGPICEFVDDDDVGVWYSFRGNDKIVNLQISTMGISDPKIAIFSGSCTNLNCVSSTRGRNLLWEAYLGIEYRILLTGTVGVINFVIDETARPVNDQCENATFFSSASMSIRGTTVGSFMDTPLDICSTSTNTRGVWYAISPSYQRVITITTSVADFSHEIVIFSGDSCEAATCTGFQKQTYSSAVSIKFVADMGIKYYVFVTGYYGSSDAFKEDGTFTLSVKEDPIPPNDGCTNATALLNLPVSLPGTTVGSLPDPSDACSTSKDNRGVWYTFTPTFGQNITISTSVGRFPHEIVLLAGNTCETATCSGFKDSTYGNVASEVSITFPAKMGQKYYVLVTGFYGTADASQYDGTFIIRASGDGTQPSVPMGVPVPSPMNAPTAPSPVVAPIPPPMNAPTAPSPVVAPIPPPMKTPTAPSPVVAPIPPPMKTPTAPFPVVAPIPPPTKAPTAPSPVVVPIPPPMKAPTAPTAAPLTEPSPSTDSPTRVPSSDISPAPIIVPVPSPRPVSPRPPSPPLSQPVRSMKHGGKGYKYYGEGMRGMKNMPGKAKRSMKYYGYQYGSGKGSSFNNRYKYDGAIYGTGRAMNIFAFYNH